MRVVDMRSSMFPFAFPESWGLDVSIGVSIKLTDVVSLLTAFTSFILSTGHHYQLPQIEGYENAAPSVIALHAKDPLDTLIV